MSAGNDISHNQIDEVDQTHQGKYSSNHSANQKNYIFNAGNIGFLCRDKSIGNIGILRQMVFHLLLVLLLHIKEETVQGRRFINLFELLF